VHAPLEVGKWSGEVVHYFVIMFVRKDNTVISFVLFIIDLCKALMSSYQYWRDYQTQARACVSYS
jgi:hypothetical protein